MGLRVCWGMNPVTLLMGRLNVVQPLGHINGASVVPWIAALSPGNVARVSKGNERRRFQQQHGRWRRDLMGPDPGT